MLRKKKTSFKVKRNQEAKRKVWQRVLLVLAFFLLFSLTVLIIFLPSRLIKIRKINCSSQYGPCSPGIETQLQKTVGQSLRQTKKAIQEILTAESIIIDFQISFQLPDTLEIEIVERKTRIAIQIPNSDLYTLIDQDGVITNFSETTNLPVLKIEDQSLLPENFVTGEKVNNRIIFSANLLTQIYQTYNTSEAKITSEQALETKLNDGTKVIFPLEGDQEILLGALQLIIAKTDRQENPYTTIDLRYKNPIIK